MNSEDGGNFEGGSFQTISSNNSPMFNGLEGYCSQIAAAQQQLFSSIPTTSFPGLPFSSQSLTAQQLVSLAQFRLRQQTNPGASEGGRDKDVISMDGIVTSSRSESLSSPVFAFPSSAPSQIHARGLSLASPGSTASSKDDRESVLSNAPTPPAVVIPQNLRHHDSRSNHPGNDKLNKLLRQVSDYGMEAALSHSNLGSQNNFLNCMHRKPTPRSTLVFVTPQQHQNPVASQQVFICTIQGQLTHGQQLHVISSNGQIFSTTIAQLALDLSQGSGVTNGNCSVSPQASLAATESSLSASQPVRHRQDSLEDSESQSKQSASATAVIKSESKTAIAVEDIESPANLEEGDPLRNSDQLTLSCLKEAKHIPKGKIIAACSLNSPESSENGINLEEIKDFAKMFKMKRLSLGLTQTQVGQALSLSEGPAYSQSAICRNNRTSEMLICDCLGGVANYCFRFEKLDITPKSAQKIKPVLEKWMREIDEKILTGQITPGIESQGLHPSNSKDDASPRCSDTPVQSDQTPSSASSALGLESGKKRKRRTSFTPQALDLLSQFFDRNTHPSGAEMTALAESLNYDREVVRVWFCNKRQALKNTIKKLKHTDSESR